MSVSPDFTADQARIAAMRALVDETVSGNKPALFDALAAVGIAVVEFIADAGTLHHLGSGMDGIDHGRDRDHVAIPKTEG